MTLELVSKFLKGATENVFIHNNYFYRNVGDVTERWDISNLSNPILIKEYPEMGIYMAGGTQTGRFLVANDNCFVVSNFKHGAKIVTFDGNFTVTGTERPVNGIAISGNNLIVGQDNAIVIYDITNPLNPVQLNRFAVGVGSLGVYTDGTYIASADYPRTLTVYNFEGTKLWDFVNPWTPDSYPENYLEFFMDVAFCPSYIAGATRNGTVHFFSYTGEKLAQYPLEGQEIGTGAKIAAHGDNIVLALHDYEVRYINMSGLIRTFDYVQLIGGYPRSVWVSGNVLGFAASHKGAALIELPNLILKYKFRGYDRVNAVITSTDRKYAYAGGDATFSIYDTQTANEIGQTDYGHSARTWHSMSIDRSRNIVFIPATWGNLKILDVNNPTLPKVLASFAIDDGKSGWNYVDAVSQPLGNNRILIHNGYEANKLIMLDYTDSAFPSVIGVVNIPFGINDIAVQGNYAYVAAKTSLIVVNISNPENMIIENTLILPYTINKIRISDNKMWVTVYTQGITVFDITNPNTPTSISGYYNPYGSADALSILSTNEIVVGMGTVGMHEHLIRLDVSNPTTPTILQDITIPGADIIYSDFIPNSNTLVITTWSSGIRVYNVTDLDPGTFRYNCSGNPNYQCYPSETGTYTNLSECLSTCVITPPLKYSCTGAPDFQCYQSETGIYATLAECQDACKLQQQGSSPIPHIIIGASILYLFLKKKKKQTK